MVGTPAAQGQPAGEYAEVLAERSERGQLAVKLDPAGAANRGAGLGNLGDQGRIGVGKLRRIPQNDATGSPGKQSSRIAEGDFGEFGDHLVRADPGAFRARHLGAGYGRRDTLIPKQQVSRSSR